MAPALAPTTTTPPSLSLTLSTPDGTILKRYNSHNGPVQLGRGHKTSSEVRSVTSGRFRLAGSEVMSSKQATLTWEDNLYAIITDNHSTNGTYLDRQGEQQRKLQAGANYRVSPVHLDLREGARSLILLYDDILQLNHGDIITFGQSVQSSKAERESTKVV